MEYLGEERGVGVPGRGGSEYLGEERGVWSTWERDFGASWGGERLYYLKGVVEYLRLVEGGHAHSVPNSLQSNTAPPTATMRPLFAILISLRASLQFPHT